MNGSPSRPQPSSIHSEGAADLTPDGLSTRPPAPADRAAEGEVDRERVGGVRFASNSPLFGNPETGQIGLASRTPPAGSPFGTPSVTPPPGAEGMPGSRAGGTPYDDITSLLKDFPPMRSGNGVNGTPGSGAPRAGLIFTGTTSQPGSAADRGGRKLRFAGVPGSAAGQLPRSRLGDRGGTPYPGQAQRPTFQSTPNGRTGGLLQLGRQAAFASASAAGQLSQGPAVATLGASSPYIASTGRAPT